MLKEIIERKKNNIGSLTLFISKRSDLLEELNDKFKNNDLTIPQKLWYFMNDDFELKLCECGKLKKWKSFKYGWKETCGNMDCVIKKRKKTNLEKYGVDNPMKNDDIIDKVKKTNLDKYGETSPSKNIDVRNKISINYNKKSEDEKQHIINKRVKTWNNKTDEEKEKVKIKKKKSYNNLDQDKIIEKRKKTNLEKYGFEYTVTTPKIKKKILSTLKHRYGVNSTPFENIEIRKSASISYMNRHIENIKNGLLKFQCKYISHYDKGIGNLEYEILCERTNKIFKIGYSNLRIRLLQNLEISPFFYKQHGISEMEKDLYKFICDNNIKIEKNNNIITPYELDIYIPELKLAFEFNGVYWHNELYKDKNYHLEKTELCEKNGVQLIHIYEDDWVYKNDIVKSMILNKLGKTPEKIYGRKCEIREIIDNKLVKDFLEKNHIQGFIGSKVKIGLFYENELVSLMTFGKRRISMGKKNTREGEYELLRFCSKLNTNVIGGAQKLFKYFVNNYKVNEITTYADRSWSTGDLYKKLGFEYKGKTQPNYYYVIDGLRHHRFNYRKDKLIKDGFDKNKTEHEIMIERGIYRIYDSGNLKFIFLI